MMVTRQKRVPWSWVWIAQIPFALWMFYLQAGQTTSIFSLQKFSSNPVYVSLIGVVFSLAAMITQPLALYLSDRVWTRWGRRKPFIVAANLVGAASLVAVPFAGDVGVFFLCLCVFCAMNSVGQVFNPLSQEIIPPPQRGRASAIHSFMFQVGLIGFFSVMIGRFDDVYFTGPLAAFGPLTGEQFTYGICALMMLIPLAIVCLGVKEIEPPNRLRYEGLAAFFKGFCVDVFNKDWIVLYLLIFAGALNIGLGGFNNLLYTVQWGYSKQDLGTNIAVGMLVMIPFTAFAGVIADKYSKLVIYRTCMALAVATSLAYVIYVKVILPDGRPSLLAILAFGEIGAVLMWMAGAVTWPLTFEYIPRNKMGTASAGMSLFSGVLGIVFGVVMGLYIEGYARIFQPGAGSEVRAVFVQSHDEAAVRGILAAGTWQGPAPELEIAPFHHPGSGGASSRQWNLREVDAGAAKLDAERTELKREHAELAKTLEDAESHGRLDPSGRRIDGWFDRVASLRHRIFLREPPRVSRQRLEELDARIAAIDADLSARAGALRRRIESALGGSLVPPGSEVRDRIASEAAMVRIPLVRRVFGDEVARIEQRAREREPAIAGLLRPAQVPADAWPWSAEGDALALVVLDRGKIADALAALASAAASERGDPWPRDALTAPAERAYPAVSIRITTVEKVSDALRVADRKHGLFASFGGGGDRGPDAVERVAKGLSSAGDRAVRLRPAADDRGLEMDAVLLVAADGAAAAEQQLLADLRESAAGIYLTVAEPVVRADFAPLKYDYFAGNYLAIIGGAGCVLVTFLISALERRGTIRKWGLLEDEARKG